MTAPIPKPPIAASDVASRIVLNITPSFPPEPMPAVPVEPIVQDVGLDPVTGASTQIVTMPDGSKYEVVVTPIVADAPAQAAPIA